MQDIQALRLTLPIAVVFLLTACGETEGDSNPVADGGTEGTNPVTIGQPVEEEEEDPEPVDPDPTVTLEIPDNLALNVTSVAYDPGDIGDFSDATLTVELSALDGNAPEVTYTRNAALDVEGFTAFSAQDDPLDRLFVGVAAEAPDGQTRAIALADGGQFQRFFQGGFYERDGDFDAPSPGLVSYAGSYAGVTNLDDLDQDQILAAPGDAPAEVLPSQPRQTVGTVFLDVDFNDNSLNGVIYDRSFTDGDPLPSQFIVGGNIADNGTFTANTEMAGAEGPVASGAAGGIFGGENSTSVAGVIALDTIFLPDDDRDDEFDREVGAFVLPLCGSEGADDALCDAVNVPDL